MTESNQEKFIRLAEKRVNSAIKAIRLVGNLSNRSNYSYSDEDIEKIFSTLSTEIKLSKQRFTSPNTKIDADFKLKK